MATDLVSVVVDLAIAIALVLVSVLVLVDAAVVVAARLCPFSVCVLCPFCHALSHS